MEDCNLERTPEQCQIYIDAGNTCEGCEHLKATQCPDGDETPDPGEPPHGAN